MRKKLFSNITVIGDGGWGTTLAKLLAEKNFCVTMWGPFPENLHDIARCRENKKYLPGIKIPKSIRFISDLTTAVSSADLLILAIPSQYLDGVLKKIRKTNYYGKPIVSVIKGIDTKTFMTMSQLIEKELGKTPLAVLSGPTIALEVARKIPTTAVIASDDKTLRDLLQDVFSCEYFRIYTNDDVVGVEICGSVKNIIALACGICDGLGFGTNTKAAILTRGLVEMARLGRALKAEPSTFFGLTGLGDLATTCFSTSSRNRYVGHELGKGRKIKAILSSMDAVAEGVVTAKAVYKLARKLKIEMPITEAVYRVIYKAHLPGKIVKDLMGRSLKAE
ncbi:MAG: NAD(P)-dependent glycerol-3-phosphate dehydrogenase [Candidatus Omnitrophica bacterium]|nr:NAD(P)-dependent glycerol-3-phosphate dehydrogenase [Candidatus Omnitrophota bacterium]